jgi:5-(carboxyamino)imidazole ribonucleotide mutase
MRGVGMGVVNKPKVAVVMGSDSDFPVLEGCIKLLKDFGIETEVMVCSAHRTPEKVTEFAKDAESKGFSVIIAAAGKAAHLPGVIAAYTILPVIGVPIKSSVFDGLDSLLSIVQMPSGVPVATVAVNGGDNAALLAVQILSGSNIELREKIKDYRVKLAIKVDTKNRELNKKLSRNYDKQKL